VRVHDQFYPSVETPSREIHDEQCVRELHHLTGNIRLPASNILVPIRW